MTQERIHKNIIFGTFHGSVADINVDFPPVMFLPYLRKK
jgi:hypothetical protein